MVKIQNWKGELIEVEKSKGGTLVVINPFHNLIKTEISPWPPPEILQKLYKSRHIGAFKEPTKEEVKRVLGFYSDLQSLHSEDAITWSLFGTLAHSDPNKKCAFVKSLTNLLGLALPSPKKAHLWLWRRIPHPDTLVSGGPEIDFGIQTENLVVFGEAKWFSKVGQAQGKAHDKNQIILRKEFFEKYGRRIFGAITHYVVLGISLHGGLVENNETDLGHAILHQRGTTWASVCGINEHPLRGELENYLNWKIKNSKI